MKTKSPKLTPSFQPRKPRKRSVVITVLGGCAYVDRKPKDVIVTIHDQDNKPATWDTWK